ncbi:hypothetical protein [Fibrella aquatilis]|uniref:Uncharacterized protein n=1 Tax=Fibrella aquatilis TaxID=2817059 RepID=A0A939G494_9BACT|nr:hypothetical protein [Fibrella aquatilis]MBO0930344.1 hypothetical protein [Fibrella aquatilis]
MTSIFIYTPGADDDPADTFVYDCAHCSRQLEACVPANQSPPDGPTLTPPGLDDDDLLEEGYWQCHLCRKVLVAATEPDDDDEN